MISAALMPPQSTSNPVVHGLVHSLLGHVACAQ